MPDRKNKMLLVVRWPVGGIRTFIRYIYPGLDARSWHFSILAPDIEEVRLLLQDFPPLDLTLLPLPQKPSALEFAYAVAKEVLTGGYDVVHSHGFTSGLSAAIPAKILGKPHIMTSHDVINDNQFQGIGGILKKIAMARLLRLIDTIHSVSEDAERNLLLHFPVLRQQKSRLICIKNGIETDRFLNVTPRDLREEIGNELHGKEDVFLIGFFGRFMSQKGFRYLVDAMELLAEASLPKRPVVVAFGHGGFVREETQSILDRGLGSYFCFRPFEPNVAGVMKGLDVVAMPSLWEACPLLPMEVLCCGTPLIASDCIGLREVVQGTPARVVPTANAPALAEALVEEMVESTRTKFAQYRETALLTFDVTKTKEKLNQVYEVLLCH